MFINSMQDFEPDEVDEAVDMELVEDLETSDIETEQVRARPYLPLLDLEV